MRLASPTRRKSEPTITLINVVFLMLLFFLVAGQVAAPIDPDMDLVDADSVIARAPDDALAVLPDGTLLWRGTPTTAEEFAAAQLATGATALRLLPARDLPAQDLVRIATALRTAGATEVRIVTRLGLK